MISLEPIALLPEEAAAVRKLEDMRTANFATAEQFRQAIEQRNVALVSQGREIWGALAAKYKLDMQHVQYNLGPTGDKLVVTAVQLTGAPDA